MKSRLALFLVLWLSFSALTAQNDDFQFRQEIMGVDGQWNSFELSPESYAKINPGGSDLRIIALKGADTLSIPFLLSTEWDSPKTIRRSFDLINKSTQSEKYFYTFKPSGDPTNPKPINSIELDFGKSNFDWLVKLEGSNNQQEWFTVLDNYRIVSIRNEMTNYSFSKLVFPSIQYSYIRISLESETDPEFSDASLLEETIPGQHFFDYDFSLKTENESSVNNRQVILIDLPQKLPVAKIHYTVNANYDYFRSVKTEVLIDSVETEKGWKRNYREVSGNSIISSIEESSIELPNTLTSGLRLTISNQDDEPLDMVITSIAGIPYHVIARFDQNVDRGFLLFGNPNSRKPTFDMGRFMNVIPETLNTVKLGPIETIKDENSVEKLVSRHWVTALIISIVLFLGYFTFRMVKEKG